MLVIDGWAYIGSRCDRCRAPLGVFISDASTTIGYVCDKCWNEMGSRATTEDKTLEKSDD